MAELLPVASTAASSADVTVAAGAKALLALKAAASGELDASASVLIERKDVDEVYTVIGKMGYEHPIVVVENPSANDLTLRVTRVAGFAVGVDEN